MKIKLIFWVMLCGAIAGCATEFDKLRNYDGNDSGNLVLSLNQSRGNPSLPPALLVRSLRSPDLAEINYLSIATNNGGADFDTPDGVGMVIAKKLPPGVYEIYAIQLGI